MPYLTVTVLPAWVISQNLEDFSSLNSKFQVLVQLMLAPCDSALLVRWVVPSKSDFTLQCTCHSSGFQARN